MLQTSNFKRIKIKEPYKGHLEAYRSDCERIQASLLDHGYYATLEQCERLWELCSEDMACSWMVLPEHGEDIYKEIKHYFEEA